MSQTQRNLSNKGQFWMMALGHFVNDVHGAFFLTLMPQLIPRMGINLAEAGFLNSASGLFQIIGQPLFGHYSDRTSRPIFAALGPALTAFSIALLSVSPYSYGWVLMCTCLWGVGSAAFHPQGQGCVGLLVPPTQLAFHMSIFGFAGMIAGTVSPYYVIGILDVFGIEGLPMVLLPALLYGGATLFVVRRIANAKPLSRQDGETCGAAAFLRSTAGVMMTIFPVWIVAVSQDAAYQGIRFFLPILVSERGGSMTAIGNVLFSVTAAGAIASLAGGHLADRFGRERFLGAMLLLAPVLLVPASMLTGMGSIVLYMIGMATINATMPVCAAMAQELAPHARAVASSLVMGVSWGLAGFVTVPVGAVADRYGTSAALCWVGFIPWIAFGCLVLERVLRQKRFSSSERK